MILDEQLTIKNNFDEERCSGWMIPDFNEPVNKTYILLFLLFPSFIV